MNEMQKYNTIFCSIWNMSPSSVTSDVLRLCDSKTGRFFSTVLVEKFELSFNFLQHPIF